MTGEGCPLTSANVHTSKCNKISLQRKETLRYGEVRKLADSLWFLLPVYIIGAQRGKKPSAEQPLAGQGVGRVDKTESFLLSVVGALFGVRRQLFLSLKSLKVEYLPSSLPLSEAAMFCYAESLGQTRPIVGLSVSAIPGAHTKPRPGSCLPLRLLPRHV